MCACACVSCSRCWGACVSCCRCWVWCWCWCWCWGGPSPLITVHPPTKLYFRQSPEPQINIYIKRYRNHPRGQKTLFTRDDIGKVQYTHTHPLSLSLTHTHTHTTHTHTHKYIHTQIDPHQITHTYTSVVESFQAQGRKAVGSRC